MVGSRKQTAFRSHRGSAPFGLVWKKTRWKGGVVGENNGESQGGVKERQGFEESVWSFQSTEGALYRAQTRQNGKGGRGSMEENNVWLIDQECGSNVDKQ